MHRYQVIWRRESSLFTKCSLLSNCDPRRTLSVPAIYKIANSSLCHRTSLEAFVRLYKGTQIHATIPTMANILRNLRRLSLGPKLTEASLPQMEPHPSPTLAQFLSTSKQQYLSDLRKTPSKGGEWKVVMGNEAGGMLSCDKWNKSNFLLTRRRPWLDCEFYSICMDRVWGKQTTHYTSPPASPRRFNPPGWKYLRAQTCRHRWSSATAAISHWCRGTYPLPISEFCARRS